MEIVQYGCLHNNNNKFSNMAAKLSTPVEYDKGLERMSHISQHLEFGGCWGLGFVYHIIFTLFDVYSVRKCIKIALKLQCFEEFLNIATFVAASFPAFTTSYDDLRWVNFGDRGPSV